VVELETSRLRLRAWRPQDRQPFAALNADPVVMEHFPATLTRARSDASVDGFVDHLDRHGYGLWATERKDTGAFIGYIGLNAEPGFEAPFLPGHEVGWRLACEHWGAGFAPEGARAALEFAFDDLSLDEVLSWTAVGNRNSRRVMDKIGLVHQPDEDFDHPNLPAGHRLSRHVLYRITADAHEARPRQS
jgi:RimJ/RimL family protein N-acetyltransferase